MAAKSRGVSFFNNLSELNQKESPRLSWGSKILDKIGIKNKVTKDEVKTGASSSIKTRSEGDDMIVETEVRSDSYVAMEKSDSGVKLNARVGTTYESKTKFGDDDNHAGDDASGGAIASRMTAQIKGLNMSVRNASDTLSLAQVAEGALDESSKVLQRIRELAIQASSDLYNGEEKLYMQTEANQLIQEFQKQKMNKKK